MQKDFNEKGYLGEEIRHLQESVKERYQMSFNLLEDLNLYSQSKKSIIKANSEDGQQVISMSLFARILNGVQSVQILSTYGLTQDARVILRSLLEGFFILAKIVKDKSFVQEYVNEDEINRLILMESSRKYSGPLFASVREIATDDSIKSLREKKDKGIRRINIETLAKDVGLPEFYDSLYRLLSVDVHCRVRSLEQYVRTDSEGEIRDVDWGPQYEDVDLNLIIAMDILLRCWGAMDHLFHLSIGEDLKEYMRKLERIQAENAGGKQ